MCNFLLTLAIILFIVLVIILLDAIFYKSPKDREAEHLRQTQKIIQRFQESQADLNQSAHEARAELIRAACLQNREQTLGNMADFKRKS
jgi:type II secretory pathway component PulM